MERKKSSKLKKLFLIFGVFVFVINVYIDSVFIYSNINKSNWGYVKEDCIELNIKSYKVTYTKEEAKIEIEKIIKPKLYMYLEKDFDKNIANAAITYLVPRIIIVKPNIHIKDYILSYTHELVHLNELVTNERYTNFRTFVILYESGNEQFKNIALEYAYLDMKGRVTPEYSCWYYIKQYLVEASVI